jgi:hypothetical protein
MPNGDKCLVVNGHLSSDYKAYQAAQTLTPNAMLDRNAVFAITFWCRFPRDMPSPTPNQAGAIVGVMNSASDGYFLSENMVWSFFSFGRSLLFWSGISSADFVTSVNHDDDAWHLVTINKTTGPNMTMYKDLDLVTSSHAGGSTTPNTGMNLCIGSYSDTGSSNGYPWRYRLAKLAVHNHALTLTERAALYNAMTFPASPGTLLVNDPCNNYAFAPWATTSGTPTISGSGHTGNAFSIAAAGIGYNLASGVQTDTLTFGAWVRFSSLSPTLVPWFQWRSDAGTTLHMSLEFDDAGFVNIRRGDNVVAGPVGTGSGIVNGTWCYIEALVKLGDGSSGAYQVRVNGVTVIAATSVDTRNNGTKAVFDQFRIIGGTLLVDDVYIRNGALLGAP